MQSDYKELAKQQQELISNLVHLLSIKENKDQSDTIQCLEMKVNHNISP